MRRTVAQAWVESHSQATEEEFSLNSGQHGLGFSAFLVLQPCNTVPHGVVTPPQPYVATS